MYEIKKYSIDRAKKLSVKLLPSNKSNYKIDVYDSKNNYITSIGDKRYSDYPTYIQTHGLEYANKRKILYHARHKNEGFRGFYSKNILW